MSSTMVYASPRPTKWPGRALLRIGLGNGAAARGVLFGLRLWAAVCLALYLSFWLQLDNPYWSGISAAVVAQPGVGAALRKGVARWVGTFAGAAAMVLLAALFPQDRVGFFVGLAVWGAGCGFLAAALRDQASYAAALAGYTAAIIAGNVIDASGQARGDVFLLALTRVTEIWIGLLSAQIVFIATDVGRAREHLAVSLQGLVQDISVGLRETLAVARDRASLAKRHSALFARITALDVLIRDAVGEAPDLRLDAPALRASAFGLFVALVGWRNVVDEIGQAPKSNLFANPALGPNGSGFHAEELTRSQMRACVRARLRFSTDSVSLQAASDAYAEALLGLIRALDALAILRGESTSRTIRGTVSGRPLDWLPALIVAARVVLAIGAVELLWVMTAWPDGGSALAYVAVSVILFSPRGAQGYAGARTFLLGCSLGVVLGGVVRFALLPLCPDFPTFCAALAVALIPLCAFSQRAGGGAFSIFAAVNFGVGLNAGNVMSYNAAAFYNQSLAVAVGSFAAVAAIALAPPLSTGALIGRATRASAREMRNLAGHHARVNLEQWGQRTYRRLADLPPSADPSLLSPLFATATAGAEIIRLRRLERRLRRGGNELAPALQLIADDRAAALAHLTEFERGLARHPAEGRTTLRARAAVERLIVSLREVEAHIGDDHGLR